MVVSPTPAAAEELGEPVLVHVVAADLRCGGRSSSSSPTAPSDVALLVGAGVLVDLDDADRRRPRDAPRASRCRRARRAWRSRSFLAPFSRRSGTRGAMRPVDRSGTAGPRAQRLRTAAGQHRRDGIIAPTSPRHRVRITVAPWSALQVQLTPAVAEPAPSTPQKMPSAAFASSDIISGLHAGRKTISGRTSPIPATARGTPHLVLDHRADRATHRREASSAMSTSPLVVQVDVVDEPEVDDVDAELWVEHVSSAPRAPLLGRRRPARGRRRVPRDPAVWVWRCLSVMPVSSVAVLPVICFADSVPRTYCRRGRSTRRRWLRSAP